MQHAAAAASKAMESSQRSSQESRPSFNRLGGPSSIGVSRSRPGSRLRYNENNASIHHHNSSSGFSTPPVPQLTTRVSIDSGRIGDIDAFPPITELDGLDGRNSSVPSSYRRLRKAKSMHTTRPRTSQTPYGVPPIPSGDPSDPDRSPGFQLPRTMRPSMSFIRGKHKSQSALNTNTNGAAVKLARNQFTQEPGEPGIRHRRSFFQLRQKKERGPFRKSFRAASEDKSPATESANSRARSAPRSLSSSIKNRLKRVFRFSKATGQQPTVEGGSHDVDSLPLLDLTIIDTSHCETLHSYRGTEQSPSRDSVCTSKSRVTSWADSTVANTARSPRKPGHRPSLSMVREDIGGEEQMPITPVKTDDEEAPSVLTPSPRHIDPAESEELYHALMAEMSRPHNDRCEMIFGSVACRDLLPEHVLSAGSPRPRGQTLRYVPSNESSSPGSFSTAQNLSALVADEHSDDARSVIVTPYMPERDVVSPSIYSRCTDEDTPPEADTADTLDVGMHDELGTATIYAPERTSYVSPEPIDRSFSRRRADPSSDWRQFLNSEVDKLEPASPAREHVRENAQLHGGEEDNAVTMTAEAALVMHTPPRPISRESVTDEWTVYDTAVQDRNVQSYSNFSRPFPRVPAIQPILPLHPKKSENSMQKPSVDPVKDNAGQMAENISPTPRPYVQSQSLSPMRIRSGNMLPPESPTPKPMAKRSLTREQLRRHSSRVAPLSHEGRTRTGQFRSMGAQRDSPSNDENQRLGERWDEMLERCYPQGQGSYPTMSSDQRGESSRTMPSEQHRGPALTEPAERMLRQFLNRPRPQRQPTTEKDSTGAFL